VTSPHRPERFDVAPACRGRCRGERTPIVAAHECTARLRRHLTSASPRSSDSRSPQSFGRAVRMATWTARSSGWLLSGSAPFNVSAISPETSTRLCQPPGIPTQTTSTIPRGRRSPSSDHRSQPSRDNAGNISTKWTQRWHASMPRPMGCVRHVADRSHKSVSMLDRRRGPAFGAQRYEVPHQSGVSAREPTQVKFTLGWRQTTGASAADYRSTSNSKVDG
jgi:hypothetical protein